MKFGEAVNALNTVLIDYDPPSQEAANLAWNHFGHRGRVHYMGHWMDFRTFVDNYAPEYKPASAVKLTFWGGAPGSRKYFQGTLLGLLVDCALYHLSEGDLAKKASQFIHSRLQLIHASAP